MSITHAKVSAKADGGDATLVRPSDWNAAHACDGLAIDKDPANDEWLGAIVSDIHSGLYHGRAQIGVLNASDSTYSIAGIWLACNVGAGFPAPSFTNYAFMGDGVGSTVCNVGADGYMGFRVGNVTAMQIYSTLEVRIGTVGSDYVSITHTGDLTFAGSAGFYPRLLNQTAEPAAGTGATQLDTGELCIWTDTDDAKCYLCYNHGGTVKTIELT